MVMMFIIHNIPFTLNVYMSYIASTGCSLGLSVGGVLTVWHHPDCMHM